MQFITNRIKTGNGKTFEDFVDGLRKQKEVKTASVTEKIAEQEEGKSSGQLDVEPLHQTGESTEMPKKGPSAKKDCDCAVKGTKTETKKEDKKEDKKEEASSQEVKAAAKKDPEKEGEDSGQPKAEDKCHNDPKVDKEAGTKGVCEKCSKPNFLCKCDGKEECKEDGKKDEGKKEASEKKFVKIANLDAKSKNFLKAYWKKLFGDNYVNALLADK